MNRVWWGDVALPRVVLGNLVEDSKSGVPVNPAVFTKLEEDEMVELETGKITLDEFVEFWKREVEPFDKQERFFRLVKRPEADLVKAKDFFPFVRELIEEHPGLEFLENTPEFQEKYARTVVARIMHRVNSSWTGEITPREMRRSNLLHYFMLADEEEEINSINEFFSYEHFYVLYCRFWDIDSDHDFLLSKDDLFRHSNHSLTRIIVDRVFQQPSRPFMSGVKGKMGYEDFCFFILCEEDKTNAISIRYWFAMVDLDADGYIRPWEIRLFYDEQLKRMKSLGHEEVALKDVLSQMKDCLGQITGRNILFRKNQDTLALDQAVVSGDWSIGLHEFLKPDLISISGTFFNLLFNLNKFIANESRDPFSTRVVPGEQVLTDWDRFALSEYGRLASAEEARGVSGGGGASSVAVAASAVTVVASVASPTNSSPMAMASFENVLNAAIAQASMDNMDSSSSSSNSRGSDEDEDMDETRVAAEASEDSEESENDSDLTSSASFFGYGTNRKQNDDDDDAHSNDGLEPLTINRYIVDHTAPEAKYNLEQFWRS